MIDSLYAPTFAVEMYVIPWIVEDSRNSFKTSMVDLVLTRDLRGPVQKGTEGRLQAQAPIL